jgi:hypothetical protein
MARERGHHEASHVVCIGKAGWKDWELKRVIEPSCRDKQITASYLDAKI